MRNDFERRAVYNGVGPAMDDKEVFRPVFSVPVVKTASAAVQDYPWWRQ